MSKAIFLIAGVSLLLQGCQSSPTKDESPADVTSMPSGATVFAKGVALGKTPLRQDLYKSFPAGWGGGAYQAEGVLMLKKDGCEDYVTNVSDGLLSKPLHVELTCNQADTATQPKVVTRPDTNTEQRLIELDALHEKGVITDDEYKVIRERILKEL